MLRGVDYGDGTIVFGADVGAGAVGQKRHGAGTASNFDGLDESGRGDVDCRNGSGVFGGHIDELAVGAYLYALRLFSHWNSLGHFTGRDVDEAGRSEERRVGTE